MKAMVPNETVSVTDNTNRATRTQALLKSGDSERGLSVSFNSTYMDKNLQLLARDRLTHIVLIDHRNKCSIKNGQTGRHSKYWVKNTQ